MAEARSPSKPFTIAIVGGGIGGLALAIGLHHRGIAAQIYEAAPAFAEVGAGIAFGSNSIRAMALIDPAIKAAFHRLATKNGSEEDEETWITFRCGLGEPKLVAKVQTTDADKTGLSSVHRAHFLGALASLLPEGIAHFSKRLADLESQSSGMIKLAFEDGTTAEADAVVGCDGVRSSVRRFVVSKESGVEDRTFTGKYAYRGLIDMAKAKEAVGDYLAGSSQMYLGPGGNVLTYPIDHGRTMNIVAFRDKPDGVWEHDHWVLKNQGKEMKRDFDGWGKPVQSVLQVSIMSIVTHFSACTSIANCALQLMDDADLWALFDHQPAPTYCKGRVAILGDAAHASTPHQGAGAGQALEDAFILSTLLADEKTQSASEIAAVFEAYDAIRRPRSQKVVSTSRAAGETYAFRGPAGDDIDGIRDELLTRYQWIWDEDMGRQARDAQVVLARTLAGNSGAKATTAILATQEPVSMSITSKPGSVYWNLIRWLRDWASRLVRSVLKA